MNLDDKTEINNHYLLCNNAAAQCITWGNEAWSSRHLGIDCKADVNEGDNPKCIFCTRTFSNDLQASFSSYKFCKNILLVKFANQKFKFPTKKFEFGL